MLSRMLNVNSTFATGLCRLSTKVSPDPLTASMEAMKEKDILCDATSNYRELPTQDKMNDYIINVNNFGDPVQPNDPKQREPVLDNAVVAQYDTEQATLNLSSHTYPHLPKTEVTPAGHPYAWLAQGSFDSIRQRKFISARLLNAHQSRNYHRGRSTQGIQSVPSRHSPYGSGVPQGVQGYHCEHSVVWKRSCDILFNRCIPDTKLNDNRRTLAEVFSKQMKQIESVNLKSE